MKPENIPLQRLPNLKNMRSLYGVTSFDNSALNIAIISMLNMRDLLLETTADLHMDIPKFNLDISNNDVKTWAEAIRNYFLIDLNVQYKLDSPRKFYLYKKTN